MRTEAGDEGELIADPVDVADEGQTKGAMVMAGAPITTRRDLGKRLGAWLGLAMAAPSVLASQGCASVLERIAGTYGEKLDTEDNAFMTRLIEAWLEVKKLMDRVLEKYSKLSIDEIEAVEAQYLVDAEEVVRLAERYNALRRTVKSADLKRAMAEIEANEIEPTMKRFNTFGNWVRNARAEKHVKKLLQLNDDNLMAEIVGKKPILVMATADWSDKCEFAIPILAQYSVDSASGARVGMARVEDEERKVLMPKFQSRLGHFGVAPKDYPTFYLFVEGNIVAQTTGIPEDAATIEKFVQSGLENYRRRKGNTGTEGIDEEGPI